LAPVTTTCGSRVTEAPVFVPCCAGLADEDGAGDAVLASLGGAGVPASVPAGMADLPPATTSAGELAA